MHKKTTQGFTIVELLIIVALMGAMASAIIASTTMVRARARDTRRMSDIKQIVNALALYWTTSSQMPCSAGQTSNEPDFLKELVTLGYLPEVPRDPFGGPYVYEYFSFQNPSIGTCGSGGAYIGFYTENPITECPTGGKAVTPHHCHIFFPQTIPCSGPWTQHVPQDCSALRP